MTNVFYEKRAEFSSDFNAFLHAHFLGGQLSKFLARILCYGGSKINCGLLESAFEVFCTRMMLRRKVEYEINKENLSKIIELSAIFTAVLWWVLQRTFG